MMTLDKLQPQTDRNRLVVLLTLSLLSTSRRYCVILHLGSRQWRL